MARLESTKRAKLKTAKQHQPSQKSKSLTCCYLLPRFWVTPYLVPIGTVDLNKKMFPSTSYSFLFQIKAVAHVYMYIMFFCMWLFIIILYTMLYNVMYDTNITYHASRDSCPLSMLQHLLSVLLSIESRNWNGLNGWPPFKPTWLQLLDFVTTFSTKNTFAVRHQVTSSLSTRTSIWSAGQGLLAV